LALISGKAEARVVQFCIQVGYVKSQHKHGKSPLKGRGQGQVSHFNFLGPNDISAQAEARVVKFCKYLDYIKSSLTDKKPPLKGRGQGHMTHFQFLYADRRYQVQAL